MKATPRPSPAGAAQNTPKHAKFVHIFKNSEIKTPVAKLPLRRKTTIMENKKTCGVL
jgi:hypothetical protein